MRARLKRSWEARAPRERTIIGVLAAIIGVVLYVWLVQTAGQERMQLRNSVMLLRGQSVELDQQTTELGRLRAARVVTTAPSDLRALVQSRVVDAGLSRMLVRVDAPTENQVKITFGAIPFADWLALVVSLQLQHVRLEACRIEALSTPGLVSVAASFTRAD